MACYECRATGEIQTGQVEVFGAAIFFSDQQNSWAARVGVIRHPRWRYAGQAVRFFALQTFNDFCEISGVRVETVIGKLGDIPSLCVIGLPPRVEASNPTPPKRI